MNNKPLVAVLGAGPSGLLAAHACAMRRVPFVIFSRKQKSILGGAQFSHIAIPFETEYDEPDTKLTYKVIGDAETYQWKVYGTNKVPFVSFENVYDGKVVPAWNLRDLYERLWEKYSDLIVDYDIDPVRAHELPAAFDLVFSSVPAKLLCFGRLDVPNVQHWFRDQQIIIYNQALDVNLPDNTILYDGTKEHSYYRMSRIFGVGSTEWGGTSSVPPLDIKTVNKPIATNCDCHQNELDKSGIPAIIRIGRFGTWQKGVLTFHAYNTVIDVLAKMGIE